MFLAKNFKELRHSCFAWITIRWIWNNKNTLGGGGDHMVSVLAFYSNSLSSNPTDLSSFFLWNCFKKRKKHKKRPFYEIIQFCIILTSTRFAISNLLFFLFGWWKWISNHFLSTDLLIVIFDSTDSNNCATNMLFFYQRDIPGHLY